MSRALQYDIPGVDWRIRPEDVQSSGWESLFAPHLEPPLRLVVELGFGRGEFLMELAHREPKTAFVGVEVMFRRVLKMARRLARTELRNVRLLGSPAQLAVRELFEDCSVACFWINFPDPWPKKRHHRRRLVSPAFAHELARRLEPLGAVNVATDHAEYAEVIRESLSGEPLLENRLAPQPFARKLPGRVPTAYELEWRAQGRPLYFFTYRRRRT